MYIQVLLLMIFCRISDESEPHDHSLNEHVEALTDLLSNYNKDMVPIRNNTPINVTLGIIMLDLVPLENVDMHFSVEMYFTQKWRDYRLVMEDYEDDNEEIVLGGSIIEKIWIPDSYFPHARIVKHHDVTTPTHYMSVRPDGEIFYSQRLSVVSRCNMNLTNFPFDKQNCQFSVESYAYDIRYIRLDWFKEDGMTQPENSDMLDFTYDGWNLDKKIMAFNFTGENTFDRLIVNLRFHRNSQWYIIQMYIPCILVVVLSWVGFWIDYRSTPARVSLGITTVLTVVTLGSSIRSSIPTTDYSKSLDYYVILCLFYVFAALIEYAIVGITDKKWRKKFKDERKKMAQSRALIANYFNRRRRNRMGNKKSTAPKNSFVNLAFDKETPVNNQSDSKDTLQNGNGNHGDVLFMESSSNKEPVPSNSALDRFRKAGETVIDNLQKEKEDSSHTVASHTNDKNNNTSNVSHHTEISSNHVKVDLATLDQPKSNKISTKVFFPPSALEREELEKTYKKAKKKQKEGFYIKLKQKINEILIKRQRRLENAHILDRISKKIFTISFLIFNIFYFAYSFHG